MKAMYANQHSASSTQRSQTQGSRRADRRICGEPHGSTSKQIEERQIDKSTSGSKESRPCVFQTSTDRLKLVWDCQWPHPIALERKPRPCSLKKGIWKKKICSRIHLPSHNRTWSEGQDKAERMLIFSTPATELRYHEQEAIQFSQRRLLL